MKVITNKWQPSSDSQTQPIQVFNTEAFLVRALIIFITHFMHQSFVTTAPPPTGNSGDNDFSSIRALLKALHCGDLLSVIALLFIRVNFTGVYLGNITSPAFTRYCGGTQKVIARTLAPLSPAHPRRWGGRGYK